MPIVRTDIGKKKDYVYGEMRYSLLVLDLKQDNL